MPSLVALSLMVSDKIFEDFKKFSSFVAMATRIFEGISLSRNSEDDHGRNISVKFHQNLIKNNF